MTDTNGVTFEDWMGPDHFPGLRITHPDGRVEYMYFNPTTDTGGDVSTVFVYQGTTGVAGQDLALAHLTVSD